MLEGEIGLPGVGLYLPMAERAAELGIEQDKGMEAGCPEAPRALVYFLIYGSTWILSVQRSKF